MNHADCHPVMCERARQTHPPCQSCCHWRAGICTLTSAETQQGCCHHNTELVTGVVVVGEVWLPDVGGAYRVEAEPELAWAGIEYEVVEGGGTSTRNGRFRSVQTAVCVADCIPPLGKYGVGGVLSMINVD